MEFTEREIRHLERLASLRLADAEREDLRVELARILTFVEQLQAIEVTGVPPTAHVLDATNAFRDDAVAPSTRPEEMLANAPDRRGPYYRVPRFVGE